MSSISPGGWTRLLTAVTAVVLVTLLVAATAVSTIEPTIARDFPDPAVLSAAGAYYAYSTASGYGNEFWHVPVQRSDDPTGGWTAVGDALPELPGWAARDGNGHASVTAPDVAADGAGGYLLYFVTRAVGAALCIGAARAGSPAGPFRPEPTPLVCQPEGVDSIDPELFTDVEGSRYLLYASGRTRAEIWLQRLSSDGLAAVGGRTTLIRADRPEEADIVEAPSLVRRGSEYVLFYSANRFDSGRYFVNYATARSPAGPYSKHVGRFLDRGSVGGEYVNPGGQDVVVDNPDIGEDLVVFHASTGPGVRAMFVSGMSWGADGAPTLELRDGLVRRYAAFGIPLSHS